ncbi:MAG: M20/M25/M40 family metallo-hydrolase [Bacteroidota bacterium]
MIYQKIVALFLGMMIAFQLTQAQSDPEITAEELETHITFLASDSLKGRKPGTPEGKVAAEYIRKQFRAYNLTLPANKGFQSLEVVHNVKPGPENRLLIDDYKAEVESDFIPMSFSASKTLTAEVVFAGYGFDISTDTITWNDYDGLDVDGKWVMAFRGDPEPDSMNSFYIPYAMERSKVVNAEDRGAAGVLFVAPPGVEEEDTLPGMFYDKTASKVDIPVMVITRKMANQILSKTGKDIAGLEETLRSTMQPAGFALNRKVSATADVITEKAQTQNVIGMIEHPQSDQYLVIGAHYDHLGMGGPSSGSRTPDTIAVHNGADDNASGVAGIIELAGKLEAHRDKLEHNVVFIAFGAEEMGLLGSKYFVQNPLFPAENITAMLNFDMIGRLSKESSGVSVSGVGTAKEFEPLLREMETNYPFPLQMTKDGYGPSDHAAFYAKDVPVLFISTGAHDDYHTPRDDADKLNYQGQKDVLDFSYDVISELLQAEALTFQKSGEKARGHQRTRLKVTFGIIPDYAGKSEKGMAVDGVRDGGPAAGGGMKKGDVIVAIDGKPVGDIYEYMHRLQNLESGQRVSVDVLRDGEKKVLILQL